jgi:hypothetical protein
VDAAFEKQGALLGNSMIAKGAIVGKLFLLLLFIMLFSVWACKTIETEVIPGMTAKTVGSPDFEFRLGLRVAVIPFSVLGNPDRTVDISEADKLSMKLQEIGFVIIESLIFQGDALHLQGLIPEGDWEAVRQVFNVDYLVFGTINYTYNPGYNLAGKGLYYGSSASVRFVDMKTGEVVIISTTDRVDGSMADEIGESITNYVFRD